MATEKLKFLDDKGREIPDPSPISVPAAFRRPETLAEQIRRLIRSDKLKQMADDQEMDTFDEAEDFDIDDEFWDPSSPYEEVFDPVLGRGITLDEFNRHEDVYRKRYEEAHKKAYAAWDASEAVRGRRAKQSGPASAGDSVAAPKPKKDGSSGSS